MSIPGLDYLVNNVYNNDKCGHGYLIISGINTGYGFFGTSVSTQKFFTLEVYDSSKNLILSDNKFGFRTTTGYERFNGFPTHLMNFIYEIDKDKKKKGNTKDIELREQYLYKALKYLGKNVAQRYKKAKTYKVKLNTVVPYDIWADKKFRKNQVYVKTEFEYSL